MNFPKNHFSYSQYSLFLRSPETYRKYYILGENKFETREMKFGKEFALMRAGEKEAQDSVTETVLNFLPSYPKHEVDISIPIKIEKKSVKLVGRFDGIDEKNHIIGEDKTGKIAWTQKRVDDFEQITWYAMMYWILYNKIPSLQLNWIETTNENGSIVLTGNAKIFSTSRTIKDFIKLQSRIMDTYLKIVKMYAKEWDNVLK